MGCKYRDSNPIHELVGQTFKSVTFERGGDDKNDEIRFTREDGTGWVLHHHQDCCETVEVNDICGEL